MQVCLNKDNLDVSEYNNKAHFPLFFVLPTKHRGIKGSLCLASVCPSVRLCVGLSGSHTFLVVTQSYVSQATRAFLGMLPLCFNFRIMHNALKLLEKYKLI